MGESFKLHAQALIGYEDAMATERAVDAANAASTLASNNPPEVMAY